jgi:hypothetical protein
MSPAPSFYSISFKFIKFLFSNDIYISLQKIIEYLEGAG